MLHGAVCDYMGCQLILFGCCKSWIPTRLDKSVDTRMRAVSFASRLACDHDVYQASVYFVSTGGVMFQEMGWTQAMVGDLYWIFALQTKFCCLRDLPNNLAICLINWWLHSGRLGSNSTLQKQRFWQVKRNHRRHWRPALVWRLLGWTNRRPINGWAVCCRRKMQADDKTILTDYKVRPVHSIFTNGSSVTKNGFSEMSKRMYR